MKNKTLRAYYVSYYVQAGYQIEVKARSAAQAEKLIRERLADERDVLDGSERVYYDDGINRCELTTSLFYDPGRKGGAA